MTLPARRRVAVLINDMNAAGGIQRVASKLVRDLGERYQTTLLSVEPLASPIFYEEGLDFQSLELRRNSVSHGRLIADLVAMGRRLRRRVRELRIDTVLALWYDMATVAAFALPSSVKRVGCEHISYSQATPSWRFIRSVSYPRLDAIVGLTREDLPLLAKIAKHAEVIPNYIDATPVLNAQDRQKILLTVGHLDARKGVDRLLWALKQTLIDHPDWKLVVVGGGEKGYVDWGYLDYVATLIKLLQLEGRVEFHPATNRIEDWYRRASVYVLGSRMEGLPMVLIEAKAYGLPIVSFDCPTGPKEIVRDGIDGYLIRNDSFAFGEAVAALIKDANLRGRMSDAALEDVRQRFSSSVVLNRWHELIEGLHVKEGVLGRRSEAPSWP
ncbi:glycosyltransferase [Bradyrhizobium sp. ORS 111]|uniref:glycosyltransferase n=1 Tax=Bradyrhizobium sp. ORS 111 TaxID=1685958 RepID=UPI003890A429